MPPNLLRVTQMNAVYLDTEIVKCMQEALRDSLKYLPLGLTASLDAELRLLIKAAVVYYSVVQTGSTFGQDLLSIRYSDVSKPQKLIYFLGSCFDYAKDRLELFRPTGGLSDLLFKVDVFSKVFHLLNTTWFLRNGSKPRLIERLLGLEQVYAREGAQRKFDSKYLGRELLWNGFIEVLVYILPLINYHKLRRKFRSFSPLHVKTSPPTFVRIARRITVDTKCAYCGETPVLPHHMGCAHIFCYVCLKGNLMADEQFQCPLCDYTTTNKSCEAVVV